MAEHSQGETPCWPPPQPDAPLFGSPAAPSPPPPRSFVSLVMAMVFVAFAVFVSAIVLWTRQTSEALLGVDSFAGAFSQVAFWAWPTFLVYLLLTRDVALAICGGAAVVALLAWGWWTSATDEHSTAPLDRR